MILRTLFLLSLVTGTVSANTPPNVVLIVADDLGWRDLGCYGSEFYETPNIDRLAESGVKFTNAYATCPVCSPSRASLMTGKYPARLGLTAHIGDAQPEHWRRDTPLKPANYVGNLALQEITLAEKFHDAGYATLHAGKWHLGGHHHWPEYQGFDVNIGGWSQGGPFGGKQYYSPYGNPRLVDGPEGEYLTDRLAAETARFIDARRFKPFFVYLPFYSVHVPLVAREDLKEKYVTKHDESGNPDNELYESVDATERVRQDHVIYAAMIEAMDEAVGVVLKSIEDAGVASNTIVVFTSDNGGLSTGDLGIPEDQSRPTTNTPLRAGKGWLYEGGIRVPLIVKAPGTQQASFVSDEVITGNDFYRSLLELANLELKEEEAPDSRSFTASLTGDTLAEQKPVYWHYPHYGNQGGRPGGAVRDGKWKLIEWYGVDEESAEVELYNLEEDLGETYNLATQESVRCQEMLSDLRLWRASHNARMPTANKPIESASKPNAAKTGRAKPNTSVVPR